MILLFYVCFAEVRSSRIGFFTVLIATKGAPSFLHFTSLPHHFFFHEWNVSNCYPKILAKMRMWGICRDHCDIIYRTQLSMFSVKEVASLKLNYQKESDFFTSFKELHYQSFRNIKRGETQQKSTHPSKDKEKKFPTRWET